MEGTMKNKDKPKREKRSKHRFQKRAEFSDQHHLRPSSRGGTSVESNLILLDAYRHDAWHLLFKNLTLDEIITLLMRLKHIKESLRFRMLEKVASSL